MGSTEVLFVGGRSGVGKSTVAFEVHEQLTGRDVAHCVIEGDNLDLGYPPPPREHRLAERNLAAMWRNYRALGQHRMVYVNTASILAVDDLVAAMGDDPSVTAVLLTATDGTARERLAGRELGSGFERHVRRSDEMSRALTDAAADWVHRVPTDGRLVTDIAAEVLALTGWLRDPAN